MYGRFLRPAHIISSTEPNTFGHMRPKSDQKSCSSRRHPSVIGSTCIKIERSRKSERVGDSSIPLMICGQRYVKVASELFVYNLRVRYEPPVATRHIASDSHCGISERLSITMRCELLAVIARSRSDGGAPVS